MTTLVASTAATAIAVFLLYTNLIVVLSQRGSVPTAASALIPFLLLLAVLHQLLFRRRSLIIDRTQCALVALLTVFLLSAFAAVGYEVAFARIRSFGREGILLYFLVRNAVRDWRELRSAVIAVLLAGSLLAGLTATQAVTGNLEQEFMGLAQRSLEHLEDASVATQLELGDEDRARGPVGDPNRFAQVLVMLVPLAFVAAWNAGSLPGRASAAVACASILTGVLLTYSRGAFLTLVVLVSLAVPLRLIHLRTLVAAALAGAILTPLVAPGYAARIGSIGGVAGLFGNAEVVADGPTQGRTTEMLAALAAYTEHPVLGVGPGQYTPYYSVHYQSLPEISIRELTVPRRAHSLYFEMAAESGTIGLLIFMSIPLLLLRDLEALRRRLSQTRPDMSRVAAGFSLAILGYLGTGAFLHLSHERYYWFMIALASSAVGVLEGIARSEGTYTPAPAEPPECAERHARVA